MKKAVVGAGILASLILLALLSTNLSTFLISDTYITGEDVQERLDIEVNSVSQPFDEYYQKEQILKENTEGEREVISETDWQHIDEQHLIGQKNFLTVDIQTQPIIQTNQFFENAVKGFEKQLIPDSYSEALRDFHIQSNVDVEGNQESSRNIMMNYEFKDFPHTEYDTVPQFMKEYQMDFYYEITDTDNGEERYLEVEYHSDDIDEQLTISAYKQPNWEEYEYHYQTPEEEIQETREIPEDFDFNEEAIEFILEYGHIRVADDGSFEIYDSLDNGNLNETLPSNEEQELPDLGEQFGGITEYELDLTVMDVQIEQAHNIELLTVQVEDSTVEAEIVEREEDEVRIEIGENQTIQNEDNITINFEHNNPIEEGAYTIETTAYGTTTPDPETGIQVSQEVDSLQANRIFESRNFHRQFADPGIYTYRFDIAGDKTNLVDRKEYEFKVHEPGDPPSAFEDLENFFNNRYPQIFATIFG